VSDEVEAEPSVWVGCGPAGDRVLVPQGPTWQQAPETYGGRFLDRRPPRKFSWKKTTSSKPGRFLPKRVTPVIAECEGEGRK